MIIKEQLSDPIRFLVAIILVFALEELHFLETYIRSVSNEIYVRSDNKVHFYTEAKLV